MRREDNKGFTLAELLIVVAIIGVLVAISIPIFSKQLEKARDATSVANIRSAYAEAMAEYIDPEVTKSGYTNSTKHMSIVYKGNEINQICVMNVELKGKAQNNWSGMGDNLPFSISDNGYVCIMV
ncbi:MAG: prepilin-type N-terminal cleavage/methylation domain-containing protein [Solobacterium sp.]|jgi:prepilin-type N-terminal cleavage/methylation domain-containing protein|nr:prepilin-type N-terminal cleavage/methylation domain-containing protein [Solobacterium sp.]MCH4049229.1 prepilin-type N-terminal cleavage/methylation domain-containing protein [Solobacterium sp.]MCH4074017.1 prepilin-type N-terminal cleavage/methylation domain-containing protein [Solobacterium sp.]MCI1436232.1 prepilin-type N-terminal cleavage/methylation domain-containing protein [Solobacterium sp.]